MKTDPGRRFTHTIVTILLSSTALLTGACATKSNTTKAPLFSPGPHVTTAEEIMQRDSLKARTRQLLDSGKYKNSADARRAAEKEYPPVVNSDEGAQEAAYYYQQQQVRKQEKFEADLDKMKRRS